MRNFRILILLLSLVPSLLHSQTQRPLTMEEAVMGLYTNLAPERISSIAWLPDGQTFSYVLSSSTEELQTYDAGTQTKKQSIPVRDIDAELKSVYELSGLHWISSDVFTYIRNQVVHRFNIKTRELERLGEIPLNAENLTFSPNHQYLVFTLGSSLAYMPADTKEKPIIIAESNDDNIIYGQTVSRSEYGITGGIFISPKNRYIAYYKKDQTVVKDYPIIDWSKTPAVADMIKYPMAGGPSETISLHIYDTQTGETTDIQADNKDNAYLTCVSWSPDEHHIYLQRLNRATNRSLLNKYDAQSGKFVATLKTTTDEKYVEPQQPIAFINDEDFILQSDESGYNHLYLYDASAQKFAQITSGDWQVNSYLGYNAVDNTVLFTGSMDDPREEHIYFSRLDRPKTFKIDKQGGWHSPSLSPTSAYIVDAFTSKSTPFQAQVIETHTEKSKMLIASRNPLDTIETAAVEEVRIIADDGTPLYAKIITPKGMDKTKKHPAIVYLYNGPHVQLVKNRFPDTGNLWYDYLASRGYVVFVMDGRGSSNRGKKFEQATYRQLGKVELQDQLKGVKFLKMQSYVDGERLGIHGWSFGGFMTTNFMVNQPGLFKAGVAGGPVMDWSMYEVMYTERYMDTPEENPEGYEASNLIKKADQLRDNLLIIHGTDDDVVVWQHSIKFIQACVDAGVQVDYFVYPGHPHNVRGKDRVHLMQKVTDYFDLYLQN